MNRKYAPECGYQNRREYRTAFEEWLATIDADLFVTLSFAQNAHLANARQSFRHWFACLDAVGLDAVPMNEPWRLPCRKISPRTFITTV